MRSSRRLAFHVLIALTASTLQAQTILFVDDDAPDEGDGSSWTTAFNDLQDALAAAQRGDEIWVAGGTYRPFSRTDPADPRSATFSLIVGVTVLGGFAGDETARDQRNPAINPTTLSGDIGVRGSRGDNSYHVVTGPNDARLDGFTITFGNASRDSLYRAVGGGMLNVGQSPTVVNCTFRDNNATFQGGGMYNLQSNPTLVNCTFVGNTAQTRDPCCAVAAAMYNDNSSSPTLVNCVFVGNRSDGQSTILNANNSNPVLVNCVLTGNSSPHPGGGGLINSGNSRPLLVNCIVWGNSGPQITGEALVNHSCIQGGWPGDGNIEANPLFVQAPGNLDAFVKTPSVFWVAGHLAGV